MFQGSFLEGSQPINCQRAFSKHVRLSRLSPGSTNIYGLSRRGIALFSTRNICYPLDHPRDSDRTFEAELKLDHEIYKTFRRAGMM